MTFDPKEARTLVERLDGYTPGPWKIRKTAVPMDISVAIHQVTDKEDYPPAFVPAWVGNGPDDVTAAPDEAIANARLIAAAPDLHAHLTAALDEIERLQNPPEEYCAKCGAPKSNHPYRHPFVSGAIKGADQ